jgi:hypothetical protein
VQFDEFAKEFARERLSVLRARLSVLRYSVLSKTYTKETVAALHKTKGYLDAAEREVAAQRDMASAKLDDYKRAGMGFDQLVREYSEILTATAEAQWQAQQLDPLNTTTGGGVGADINAAAGAAAPATAADLYGSGDPIGTGDPF